MALTDKLTSIADAIRDKTGKTEEMTLDQMATEIAGIETGGGEDYLAQRLTNTITHYENNSITKILGSSFRDCVSLVSIHCENVTLIKENAFYGAINLETAHFPSVTEMWYAAFRDCFKLKEFVVLTPQTRASGGNGESFSRCEVLEKVDININKIDDRFFWYCKALNAIILRKADAITINGGTNTFTGSAIANGTGYIYVPSALLETYKTATNWSVYADRFRAIEGSEYE